MKARATFLPKNSRMAANKTDEGDTFTRQTCNAALFSVWHMLY
jgi:hypothetical protein